MELTQPGSLDAALSRSAERTSDETVLLVLPWSPDHPAGVSVVVRHLKREMIRGGMPTLIAVDTWEAQQPAPDKGGNILFRFRAFGGSGASALMKAMLTVPRSLRATHRLLRDYRVAAVNFHYPSASALGVALLKRLGFFKGRIVLSFHGTDVRAPRNLTERLVWRLIFGVAEVNGCSEHLAERLCEAYGLPRSRIATVNNGADTSTFSPSAAGAFPRPVDGRYLVSVGGYIPRKNHDLLVRAFAKLDAPDVSLVIVGMDGPEREKIVRLADTLHIGSRLHCLVDRSPAEVAAIVAGAEACVQPSKLESFPLVVLEAGACAVPIIASAIGSHAEMLRDGVTGYLYPTGDADACVHAMKAVLADRAGALAVGRRFHDEVVSRYTWAATAAGYARLMGVPLRAR